MSFVHKPTVQHVDGGTVTYNHKHQCNPPPAVAWAPFYDAIFECSDCHQKWEMKSGSDMRGDDYAYWSRQETRCL